MFTKLRPGFIHWVIVPCEDDRFQVEVHFPSRTFWRLAWGWKAMISERYATEEDALLGGAAAARKVSEQFDGFEIPRRECKPRLLGLFE